MYFNNAKQPNGGAEPMSQPRLAACCGSGEKAAAIEAANREVAAAPPEPTLVSCARRELEIQERAGVLAEDLALGAVAEPPNAPLQLGDGAG